MDNTLNGLGELIEDNHERLKDRNLSLEDREKLTKLMNEQVNQYAKLYSVVCSFQDAAIRIKMDRDKLDADIKKFEEDQKISREKLAADIEKANNELQLNRDRLNEEIRKFNEEKDQREKQARRDRIVTILKEVFVGVGSFATALVLMNAKYDHIEKFARERESFEDQHVYTHSTGKKLSQVIDFK